MVLCYPSPVPLRDENEEKTDMLFAFSAGSSPEAEALAARRDEQRMEAFLRRNRRFILGCASKTVKRFVTESDDEWSVALIAFHEAVQTYDESRGAFRPFAALVIRRRLLDHLEKENRTRREIGADLTSGESADSENPSAVQLEAQKAIAERSIQAAASKEALKDEIEAMQQILGGYGFSFFDLADCSPKAQKTKTGCAAVISALIADDALMKKLRETQALPVTELCRRSGAGRKLLEKHRKYIIAAGEILYGDYPYLAEYLRFVKKGGKSV